MIRRVEGSSVRWTEHGPKLQQGVLIVKRSFQIVAATAILSLIGASIPATAHAAGNGVVVIDIVKVFKAHVRFNQSLEIMKKDVEVYQAHLRREQQKLVTLAESLKDQSPSSPQFKSVEAQVTKAEADLQVDMSLKSREFTSREAKLYYDTYVEITNKVAEFADQNGITLVIRYNGTSIDQADRQSVMEGINNAVIFQNDRDITSLIINEVNRGSMTPQQNATRPALPPRR